MAGMMPSVPPQDTLLAGEEGPVQIGQAPVEDVADEKRSSRQVMPAERYSSPRIPTS